MERVFFHVDVNSAFLSWSALKLLKEGHDDLRLIASCVGGDEKSRHGIVLAKSILAAQAGCAPASLCIWQGKSVRGLLQ